MSKSYWSKTTSRHLSRRRVLTYGGSFAAAAAFLAACGGDDDDAGPATGSTGATGGTGTTGAAGATGGTGATGNTVGYEAGGLAYRRNFSNLTAQTNSAVEGGLMPLMVEEEATTTLDGNLESSSNRSIYEWVYEQLARLNGGPDVEFGTTEFQAPIPSLATSWEIAPDAMKYTFKIRKGVKFQNVDPVNGREMDIEDVKTSLDHFMADSSVRGFLNDTVASVDTPDEETLVFNMKKPYGIFLERGALGRDTFNIVPKELTANPDLAATKAIGTNYKVLDEWNRDVSWNYVRFDEYWGGKPFIERWRYAIVPELANRRAQFLAQQALRFEYTAGSDQRDALQLRKDAPEAIMLGEPLVTDGYNVHRIGKQIGPESPWFDERVRIALRRAVNYEGITDVLASKKEFADAGIEVETAMSTHAPPDPRFWLDPNEGALGEASQNYLYNADEAKKLLEAAGFPDGFEIPLFTSENGLDSDSLTLYRQEMERFGLITLKVEALPSAEYFNRILLERNFGGIVSAGRLPANPPDYFLSRYVHSAGGNTAFPDPEMDAIIERYQQAIDNEVQVETLKEYQRYAATKFYQIPGHGQSTYWSFEWPWLHDPYHDDRQVRWPSPVAGAHMQWLDESMPNRAG